MKEVIAVPLPNEGINTIAYPEHGRTVGVVVGPGYLPALSVIAERGAATEKRDVYVTRGALNVPEDCHAVFVGLGQEQGQAARYVFELEGRKGKK